MREYYDFDGDPIDIWEWAHLFHSADRHVAHTELDGITVSTVWLGLDHSFDGRVPLIYETMIFGGAHDEYQYRYPNKDAALAGHDQAVALATSALVHHESEG